MQDLNEWGNSYWKERFEKYLSDRKEQPSRFLEIGSYKGDSALWLCLNILNEDSKLDCIEINKQYIENIKLRLIEHEVRERVDFYNGKSSVILRGFCNHLLYNKLYDFIYVDGNHSAHAVLTDAVLSFFLLKSGGLMAFDDYKWPLKATDDSHPSEGIDAFVNCYRNQIRVIEKSYQVWIQKL